MSGFKTYPHPELNPENVALQFVDEQGNEQVLPIRLSQQNEIRLALKVRFTPPLPPHVQLDSLKAELMLRDVGSGLPTHNIMEQAFRLDENDFLAEFGTFHLRASDCSKTLAARVRIITTEPDLRWRFDAYRVLYEFSCSLMSSGPENFFPFRLDSDSSLRVPWYFDFSGELDSELEAPEPPLTLVLNTTHPVVKACLEATANNNESLVRPLRRLAMVDCLTDFLVFRMRELADGYHQKSFPKGTVGWLMNRFLYPHEGNRQPRWTWVDQLAQKREIPFELRLQVHHDLAELLEQQLQGSEPPVAQN